jgi:hypothetical protein
LLLSSFYFFIFYKSFSFFWFNNSIFYFGFSKKLFNKVVWLFSLSSSKLVFGFFNVLSKPIFYICLSLCIYKISKLVIFTFVLSCLCFLLCCIGVMVFSLIHGFLGCCFNFPNVSFAAVVIACFQFSPCWLYLLSLSLYSLNFTLSYYYSFLFPFLPLVFWLPFLSY